MEPAGIVVGAVDTYSSERPVKVMPFVSRTVADKGCGVFRFTVAGEVLVPGTERAIDAGGQVEKYPVELAALAIFAVIKAVPGWFAVAMPFWSMDTTLDVLSEAVAPCAEYCKCPARQLMFVCAVPAPA